MAAPRRAAKKANRGGGDSYDSYGNGGGSAIPVTKTDGTEKSEKYYNGRAGL